MPCGSRKPECPATRIKTALHHQQALIANEIEESIVKSDHYVIDKIKTGKAVDFADDSSTLFIGEAFQAPVRYRKMAKEFPGIMEAGHQKAKASCDCGTAKFNVQVNKLPENACDSEVCRVQIAQGFRTRGFDDYEVEIATDIQCITTLAKFPKKRQRQVLKQERESIITQAYDSFDTMLLDAMVERGEANSVVLLPDHNGSCEPVLTGDGWRPGNDLNAIGHVSLYYLERYRRALIPRLTKKEGNNADNCVLELEMTRDAWEIAVLYDSLHRSKENGLFEGLGGNIRLDKGILAEGKLKGRDYVMWNGIKVVFNDRPIRGYLKPTGRSSSGEMTYEFVRVYPMMNVPGEDAGTVMVSNPNYYGNTVSCDGYEHPLFEAILHIHKDSFVRHPLLLPAMPKGVTTQGNQFQIAILQGADLSSEKCPNYRKDKYGYYIHHQTRIRDVYPELSGLILHRPMQKPGYGIPVKTSTYALRTGVSNATMAQCDECDGMKCHPECPSMDCTDADNIVVMSPNGKADTSYFGESKMLKVAVKRDKHCSDAPAVVTYRILEGTAVHGTHFQPVDVDGHVAPLSGKVEWNAHESGRKDILIRIDGALADSDASFTVELQSSSGCTIQGDKRLDIAIKNRM